jgi:hypothetical protein
MSIEFKDTNTSLSQTLSSISETLGQTKTITVRDLIAMVGEQGLLLMCALISLPFLTPISIPGVSTVFGAAIILIGLGVTLNRVPWLPTFVAERPLDSEGLKKTLIASASMAHKVEAVIRPRLSFLSDNALINRVNGLAVVFSGILLMFPLGLIPLSNTLPGLAILFLALGIVQRDGLLIIAGYAMMLATVIYFGFLAVAAIATGAGLMSLIGS